MMVSYTMIGREAKVFLVIPTIRDLNFLKSWGNNFSKCNLIVVEDRQRKSIKVPKISAKSVHHYSWEDIDRDLGKNNWIISRHNAGVRSYGFYKAYKLGADVIMTIDDDCYPTSDNFVEGHLDNLNFRYSDKWINTYPDPKWMYTRGVPYKIRDKITTGISHGIWSGALDLDGLVESKLPNLLNEKSYPQIRQAVPFGCYYPMCSMNLAFGRKVTPLMFFPMMGQSPDGRKWPYDRFDDIWAGVFSKKIMDHLGLGVINGSPIINHKKASKPKENQIKEMSGMKINETLWKKIDEVELTSKTPKNCYIELAQKANFPKNYYFNKLKEAMIIWANLF